MSTDAHVPGPLDVATTTVCGMPLARLHGDEVVDLVFAQLARRCGGWIVTANLDFLKRYDGEPAMRALYDAAELRVADGMPLVWAARLQGDPLPERVTGSSLIWLLAERAAEAGRSIYLLGGTEQSASAAVAVFRRRFPGLVIAGHSSPWINAQPTPEEAATIAAVLQKKNPSIVLVGLGSPKQERLIHALRGVLPETWWMGVGISFSFVAGDIKRAPAWMQKAGLEWAHRLTQEPSRLAKRYLVDDAPFGLRLLVSALVHRVRSRL